jgi:hypothetical protein
MTTPTVQTLPYERLLSEALRSAIFLFAGEQLLLLQPFGWHLDGQHIPNMAEHFSRDGVCRELGLTVVCEFGPYVAVVCQSEPHDDAAPRSPACRRGRPTP